MMNIIGGLTLCPCFSLLLCKKKYIFQHDLQFAHYMLTGGENERRKARDKKRGRDTDGEKERELEGEEKGR